MQWSTGACLCAVLLLQLQGPVVDASFWDTIPVVSQVKSIAEWATGDKEAAARTQDNFLSQMPVVSQVKSAVELATGNTEAALDTQKRFLNNAENMVDGTPVVGHIKGGIHMITGDEEHGLNIIKGATSNTGTAIGGILLGPAGAVGGRLVTDIIISDAELAAAAVNGNKQDVKPYGTFDYLINIHKKSVGEHVDALVGVAKDASGGRRSKRQYLRGTRAEHHQ